MAVNFYQRVSKKYHLVPECLGDCNNIMGYDSERVKRISYVYLHGALEDKACEFGGYDIFGFLDDVPEEVTGIYNGFVEYPDKRIDCTIFLWKDTMRPGSIHGLVVSKYDIKSYNYVIRKFSEKAFSI